MKVNLSLQHLTTRKNTVSFESYTRSVSIYSRSKRELN